MGAWSRKGINCGVERSTCAKLGDGLVVAGGRCAEGREEGLSRCPGGHRRLQAGRRAAMTQKGQSGLDTEVIRGGMIVTVSQNIRQGNAVGGQCSKAFSASRGQTLCGQGINAGGIRAKAFGSTVGKPLSCKNLCSIVLTVQNPCHEVASASNHLKL